MLVASPLRLETQCSLLETRMLFTIPVTTFNAAAFELVVSTVLLIDGGSKNAPNDVRIVASHVAKIVFIYSSRSCHVEETFSHTLPASL